MNQVLADPYIYLLNDYYYYAIPTFSELRLASAHPAAT